MSNLKMADIEIDSLLQNYEISWKIITIIEIIECFLVLYRHKYKTVNGQPGSINKLVYSLKPWKFKIIF